MGSSAFVMSEGSMTEWNKGFLGPKVSLGNSYSPIGWYRDLAIHTGSYRLLF